MGAGSEMVAAMDGQRGPCAADRLCAACVTFLEVDAAAISLIVHGANTGTLGASGDSARTLDELQFTFGEGPCLEAVASAGPVLVADLADPHEVRWPAYTRAMLDKHIRGVFALPVSVGGNYAGALDLYRTDPGQLSNRQLDGALAAAELAQLPLLDLLAEDLVAAVNEPSARGWNELVAISRVEVNQATGVLVAQLGTSATEALVRLRAYAYAHDLSATEVARAILDHRPFLAGADAVREQKPGREPDDQSGTRRTVSDD
jgi:ANTAR domain/GAF domain